MLATIITVFKELLFPLWDRLPDEWKGKLIPGRKPGEARHWLERLNAAFAGWMTLHGLSRSVPLVRMAGEHPLTAEERAAARAERARIVGKKPNDLHAVLSRQPVWSDNPVVFEVWTLDFADVATLRKAGQQPEIVSAGAVVLCAETRELVLHRRSKESATYPGALHIVGGGYIPPGRGREGDGLSLLNTVRREVLEETRVSVTWSELPPVLLAKELATGFIQVVLLGVNLTAAEVERLDHGFEGESLRVRFDDLPRLLQRHDAPDSGAVSADWVPTGKAHVLAWLALGAPGAGKRPKFGKHSATELFDLLVP
jgi:8-oxo-dGTP pyrophosphatase MutT (NUDIX family)